MTTLVRDQTEQKQGRDGRTNEGPAKDSPKRHLIRVDKFPCPGDTLAHSGLGMTVKCLSVHYSPNHGQHVTSRPSDSLVSNRAGISIVHTARALKRPHRAMI